jgi:tRNA pseudouridine38-40 synthase
MARYFLELFYRGTGYSGFQSQKNANTIQSEVEKAFEILHRQKVIMTGSSRTDAGVHAYQNFFHFDYEAEIYPHVEYKMNAILPADIVIKQVKKMPGNAHCRFDAVNRVYQYHIYRKKNPFLKDRAFFFPYMLDMDKMQTAASVLKDYEDFTSFSKRKTQVKTTVCKIYYSEWVFENDCLVYKVCANRFLRGMVRAMTATMLKVGRKKISIDEFKRIVMAKDCTQASFAVPSHGLFLMAVNYPDHYFSESGYSFVS